MLMVLINIVIVIVVGAILFYLIDKYVRDGRLGNLLKILVGLICLAAEATSNARGGLALRRFSSEEPCTSLSSPGLTRRSSKQRPRVLDCPVKAGQ
jgi:hypothetical protein